MEESKVVLGLKEYTDIIIERENLKRTLSDLKRKILSTIEDKINDGLIYNMSKEQLITLLETKDEKKVFSELNVYLYSLESIAKDNYYILSEKEVRKTAYEIIMTKANDRLKEIQYDEEHKD